MIVKTETNEIDTHYEFICYYEHKRVALIEQTLDALFNSYAVKVLAWFTNNDFEFVTDAYRTITEAYDISEENQDRLMEALISYNNGEFDTPYKVEFVKVTYNGTIIGHVYVDVENSDIEEIIYDDYLNAFPDELLDKLIAEMSELITPDTEFVFDNSIDYSFNESWNNIEFESLNYYSGTIGGHIRSCILEILMAENIRSVLDVNFDTQEEVIYLDTDKGQLIICLEGED
jgi:hypothetical protein